MPSILCTAPLSINPIPVYTFHNPHEHFGIIAGISFHPKDQQLFATTFFSNNKVALYTFTNTTISLYQALENPQAQLAHPHGITFHPSGQFLVVTHYGNHTITVYSWNRNKEKLNEKPVSVFTHPSSLKVHNSHGIAFSPKGDCLAVAYCDCDKERGYEEKVVLFSFKDGTINPQPLDILEGTQTQLGNPKGVAFSKDGTCLLVTMCDTNALAVYDINTKTYAVTRKPRQLIQGLETQLSRPEDVTFSPDGSFIAVTNSNSNTLVFYTFDQEQKHVPSIIPIMTLKNPEAELMYPHGCAFSKTHLGITHFGIPDGPVIELPKVRQDKITFYRYKK